MEIAELLCMNLLQHLLYAPWYAMRWIADEREYYQVCGYLTIARLLMSKGDMTERAANEMLDQAIAAAVCCGYNVRRAAMTAIRNYMRHSEENAFRACRYVESMKNSNVETERALYNMVAEEAI
jgi:uncharacterized protein (UPF0147 family)